MASKCLSRKTCNNGGVTDDFFSAMIGVTDCAPCNIGSKKGLDMVFPFPDCLTKQLFEPLGEHEFWQQIYGKTWHAFLQNPENPKRFEPGFSHASFLKLLQVPSTWSQNNVKLVVNGTVLPTRQYC